jgi:hypothetical protein
MLPRGRSLFGEQHERTSLYAMNFMRCEWSLWIEGSIHMHSDGVGWLACYLHGLEMISLTYAEFHKKVPHYEVLAHHLHSRMIQHLASCASVLNSLLGLITCLNF